MKISTNTNALAAAFGEEVAIKEIIKAGFDAIDISCFEMLNDDSCPKLSDNYKEYAKKLLSLTQGTGVYFNQAHAPFPSSKTDEEFNKKIYEKILRCMEFCSVLGVRNIVVHPLQHLKYADPDSPEILKEMNLEFYNSLIAGTIIFMLLPKICGSMKTAKYLTVFAVRQKNLKSI